MEAKFGPLNKTIKTFNVIRDEIFQNSSRVHPFDHKRKGEMLEELTVEPVDKKLRRYQSLATTCNQNVRQQDAKHVVNYRPMDEDNLENL